MKRLVYFCPASDKPAGGVKVIYRHAEIVNAMRFKDWSAEIFHWDAPQFCCTWFDHHASIKNSNVFQSGEHFALLPECHLYDFGRQLASLNIRYGIFVQNGYLIGANDPRVNLFETYSNAEVILTISDDTAECVKRLFPEFAQKIVPIRYSIPSFFTEFNGEKENLITFMPRKMGEHARLVILFLSRHLPSHWRIAAIDGMSERDVAAHLQRSKLFMAFSALEGLPVPPVEAALCGNHVIGYTGEGGKEYWDPDLFTEIEMGNIRRYVTAVLNKVHEFDNRVANSALDVHARETAARGRLRDRFSMEREQVILHEALCHIDNLMTRAGAPTAYQGEQ